MSTPAPRPQYLEVDPAGIPAELRALPMWALWRSVWEPNKDKTGGRWTKMPWQVQVDAAAKSNDPSTLSTFDAAIAALRRHPQKFSGVLAAVPDDAPYVFCEVDGGADAEYGCVDQELYALLEPFIGRALVEFSPGGRGVHVVALGEKPQRNRSTDRLGYREVAAFGRGKFLTFTGQQVPGCEVEALVDATTALRGLYAAIEAATPQKKQAPASEIVRPALEPADDDVVRAVAGMAKAGPLLRGDMSPYRNDHSRADGGLIYAIVHARAATPAQVERIFKATPLYRPEKWTQPQTARDGSASTYGAVLIADAFADVTPLPDRPPQPRSRSTTAATATSTTSTTTRTTPGATTAAPLAGEVDASTPCSVRVLELERELAEERRLRLAAEDHARQLSALMHQQAQIRRNKHLSATDRNIGITLTNEFANAAAAADRTDERGMIRAPLGLLGDNAGASADTASRSVQKLERALEAAAGRKILRREVRPVVVGRVDLETGEVLEPGQAGSGRTRIQFEKHLYIGLVDDVDAVAFAEALAKLEPTTSRNHGGKRTPRPACPDHPGAGLLEITNIVCAECRVPVVEPRERHLEPDDVDAPDAGTDDLPVPMVAALRGSVATTRLPQVVGSGPAEVEVDDDDAGDVFGDADWWAPPVTTAEAFPHATARYRAAAARTAQVAGSGPVEVEPSLAPLALPLIDDIEPGRLHA